MAEKKTKKGIASKRSAKAAEKAPKRPAKAVGQMRSAAERLSC